jgi:hypothetical protein
MGEQHFPAQGWDKHRPRPGRSCRRYRECRRSRRSHRHRTACRRTRECRVRWTPSAGTPSDCASSFSAVPRHPRRPRSRAGSPAPRSPPPRASRGGRWWRPGARAAPSRHRRLCCCGRDYTPLRRQQRNCCPQRAAQLIHKASDTGQHALALAHATAALRRRGCVIALGGGRAPADVGAALAGRGVRHRARGHPACLAGVGAPCLIEQRW